MMCRKKHLSTFLLIVIYAAFLLVSAPPLAMAQSEDLPDDSLCRQCHEDEYYLYDTGKWYCLCGKQRTCVDCHGGDPNTNNIDEAHAGIIVNPIADNPAICKDCHPDDYEAQIVKFAAVAGIDPSTGPIPTSTPILITTGNVVGDKILASPLNKKPGTMLNYILRGFLFLGFLGVVSFGYRCWKADCMQKEK